MAGQVNMKSFLMGSPDIKIGLNEDLTIGKEERRRGNASTIIIITAQITTVPKTC